MRSRPSLRLIAEPEPVEHFPKRGEQEGSPPPNPAGEESALPDARPGPRRPKRGAWFRRKLRSALLLLLRKLLESDEGKALVADTLRGLLQWRPALNVSARNLAQLPYPDLGQSRWHNEAGQRGDAILITARFRSGSTLLWNIFRHVEGCVAFYEPFNERRWFDPACRGRHVDPTHRQVDWASAIYS